MPSVRALALAGTALSNISLSQSWYIGGGVEEDDGFTHVSELEDMGYDLGNDPDKMHHSPPETPRRTRR